jgi:hypothetical protein
MARMDRRTRERAQQQLLRSIEREVYEQQLDNVRALQEQLEQLDRTAHDYDLERGEAMLRSLNKGAVNARARAWRGHA